MKYLKELQQKKLFTLEDVSGLTGNISTAKSLLQSYKKAGYVAGIRRNLYAALDLATGSIIASRYEIASQISDHAYVSYHSAMEFHGVANQVFYEVQISSDAKISPYAYDGLNYTTHKSCFYEGVETVPYNDLIRVTNIERTIVDCMHNIELAGGMEELLQCIDLVPQIDEALVMEYLNLYDEKYLWQKAGWIMEQFADRLRISSRFFDECERNIGKRKNYLGQTADMHYSDRWKLYIPNTSFNEIGAGGEGLV